MTNKELYKYIKREKGDASLEGRKLFVKSDLVIHQKTLNLPDNIVLFGNLSIVCDTIERFPLNITTRNKNTTVSFKVTSPEQRILQYFSRSVQNLSSFLDSNPCHPKDKIKNPFDLGEGLILVSNTYAAEIKKFYNQ